MMLNREEVKDHCVKWGRTFEFDCKMNANASNGVLNSCMLRISVRKVCSQQQRMFPSTINITCFLHQQESSGGRSSLKLGFVDIDLAEFAGAGLTRKRYLLEAYSNTHHRSDNSTLKLNILMSLLHGDPLFKRPSRANSSFYAPLPLTLASSSSGAQVASASSSDPTTPNDPALPPLPVIPVGPSSLSSSSTKDSMTDGVVLEDGKVDWEAGSLPVPLPTPQLTHIGLPHNEATTPTLTVTSASSTLTSSTTSTTAVSAAVASSSSPHSSSCNINGHSRNTSQLSKTSSLSSAQSRQGSIEVENRVDSTRVNPDDIIQELMATNLTQTALTGGDEEGQDEVGLEIFVGKDGTATLGSRSGTNERRRKKRPQSSSNSVQNPNNNQRIIETTDLSPPSPNLID